MVASGLDIPFILVSGAIEEELAILALKRGAADYLMKDHLARLGQAIHSALDLRRIRAAQRQAADELRRSEIYFRSLIENSSEIILVLDSDGRILYASPSLARTLGYDPADRIGHFADENIHPDDLARVRQAYFARVGQQTGITAGHFEVRVRHLDGSWRIMEVHSNNLLDNPAINGFVVNMRDVTERKRAEEELRHISTHDALTGLYNRTYFDTEVDRLKQSRLYPVSVIMIDIDRMKQVNDSQGHSAGDELLRRTAGILKQCFRSGDVLARIGGDEFAVLLPQTDDQAVENILNRIRIKLFANQIMEETPLLSFSVGSATAQNDEKLEEVIQRADKSMYLDKIERTRSAKTRRHPGKSAQGKKSI